MTQSLVVVGAGGFGRETLDVVEALGETAGTPPFELLGVLDDAPRPENLARLEALGAAYLGTVSAWLATGETAAFVVAIGSPAVRATVAARLEEAGLAAATLVHPRAGLGRATTLAPGTVVCAGAQISTNVTLGRHVHVNPNATIGHDSTLADHVSINPGAIVSGDVVVEEGVLVGAGAVILQGLAVGAGSLVGAAACVVRDVPPGATVKGVPAR